MKKLVRWILLLGAVVVGVGFYRGWFTVNKDRIEQDEKAAQAELEVLEQQVKDKATDLKQSVKD